MTRRSFVAAGAAFAGGCYGGFRQAHHGETRPSLPKMKIGILSDIHVTRRENAGTFEKALRWFHDQMVDGVLVTGDLGTKGTIAETEVVAETWYRVFPGDKAPDGRRVERLFLLGNHDVDGFVSKASWPKRQIPSREEAERTCLAFHREEAWKRLFNEDYSQIVVKEVKGYKFVLNSWVSRELHEKDRLVDFWKDFAPAVDPSKPFFYCQHPHPKDTCSAGYLLGGAFWHGGWDDGTSTRLLSRHANCIALSGHSHYSIDDERAIWQGMLMEVFDDCVVFHRREFVYDQVLGPDWVVPLGKDAPRPYAFEPRRRASRPPQFAEGASVDVVERPDGKNRKGVACEQVVVTFPSAKGEGVFDYAVDAEVRVADFTRVCASKRVFSPDAFLGSAQDGGKVACVFAKDELPAGRDIRFVVRPFNCWGKCGEPIAAEFRRFQKS